ncbi:MAG: NUDIX domain-containing protein [Pseudomonadales bacterium]
MSRDTFAVVVHVLLTRPGVAGPELFLLRRAGTGFMDGYYALPGGHQHAGEGVQDAARRECLEETGARAEALAPVCVLPYQSGRHQGLNFVFEVERLAGWPGLAEPCHSDVADWFPLGALPAPIVPWLDDVLELRRRGEWFRELRWD